jgi:hypothetical protein
VSTDRQPHVPSLAEVAAIVATEAAVLRNLRITQAYHDISLALARALSPHNLSWCGYASWASKTAGGFIRGDALPAGLRALGEDPRLPPGLQLRVQHVLAELRGCIAAGNLKVFAELGPCFTRLIACLHAPVDTRADQVAGLLAGLRPGASEQGGQDLLREAFTGYLAAAALPEGKAKAERIFHANALVGYHEQIRLQDAIAGALAAVRVLIPEAGDSELGRWLMMRFVIPLMRSLSTRWFMRIELPGRGVPLGRDVPRLACGAMVPAELQVLELPALRALLARLDRTPDTTRGSAARDWADLGDRMNYIVDLFRSHQQAPQLRAPVFSPAQVWAIRAGEVPLGPL